MVNPPDFTGLFAVFIFMSRIQFVLDVLPFISRGTAFGVGKHPSAWNKTDALISQNRERSDSA